MIDEKKLIEELEKQCPDWKSSEIGYLVKGTINDCIEIIKRQPKVGEWIPVSERLPYEYQDDILLYTGKLGEVDTCCFNWFIDHLDDMVAWQPLPKAYEVVE